MKFCRLAQLTACVGLMVSPSADAALIPPVACEIADAGDTTGTAQVIPGGAAALDAITGTIADQSDVDLYQIVLSGAPFSASTTTVVGAVNDFDTQLFLFDINGFGLLSNDDFGGSVQSMISGNFAAGTYYLGISKSGTNPVDGNTDLIFDANGLPVVGVGPLGGWVVSGASPDPPYSIALTGVVIAAVPEPSSFALAAVACLGTCAFRLRRRKATGCE